MNGTQVAEDALNQLDPPVAPQPAPVEPPAAAAPAPAPVAPPEPPVAAPVAAPTALTKEDIAAAVTASIREITPQAPPQQPARPSLFQPTQDQIDRILIGGDEAVKAMGEVVDNLRTETIKLNAQYVQQQLEPLIRNYQKQQEAELEQRFQKKFPDLAEFTDLAKQVATGLVAQGVVAKTEDEGFEMISKAVRQVIAKVEAKRGGNGAAPPPPAPPPSRVRTPAVQLSPEEQDMADVAAAALG